MVRLDCSIQQVSDSCEHLCFVARQPDVRLAGAVRQRLRRVFAVVEDVHLGLRRRQESQLSCPVLGHSEGTSTRSHTPFAQVTTGNLICAVLFDVANDVSAKGVAKATLMGNVHLFIM